MKPTATERRRQIIDSATELFSSDGYEKATVKQIAQTCDVTEAALYRHFSSKAEIYTAVLESLEERLSHEGIFATLADEKDIERLLRGLAEHILRFFGKNEDVYRLLLFAALQGHARAKRVFTMVRGRYIKFLKKRLDELCESGVVVEKNNEITARCFVGMVFDCALGLSIFKGMQGRMFPPAAVVDNNIPIYVKGLQK
jgi:AcrR family transcriptional regulator